MAAYLALKSKIDGTRYANGDLVKVDEMLCSAMGIEPDPDKWYYD
jgi:hypothetical protein